MKRLALLLTTCAALVPAVASAGDALPGHSNTLAEVKFRFDSAELPADASARLGAAVSYAASHTSARIVLDAHCDPIGAAPYNAALAVRRAESVRAQLLAAGVPEDQIVVSIYGEDGAPRASYADDRRVTLWWTREPLAVVASEAFTARSTAVRWAHPLTVAEIQSAPEPVASR